MECFRCVCHDILSEIYLTLLPYGWYFTRLRIIFHHPLYLVGSEYQKIFGVASNFLLYFVLEIADLFLLSLLSLSWNCICNCIRTKINGTNIWRLGLETIIIVSTVNNTWEWAIEPIRNPSRVFFQLGTKLERMHTSDRLCVDKSFSRWYSLDFLKMTLYT